METAQKLIKQTPLLKVQIIPMPRKNGTWFGVFPLHFSVTCSSMRVTKLLIAEGLDINGGIPGDKDCTPIIWAKQPEMVRMLISNGANVGAPSQTAGQMVSSLFAYSGSAEMLKEVLQAGASPNYDDPKNGLSPLHMATYCSWKARGHREIPEDFPSMKEFEDKVSLLLEKGANPNKHCKTDMDCDLPARLKGETPLHFAASYGSKSMLEKIIESGGDTRRSNCFGEYPMNYAERNANQDIIEFLTEVHM